MADDIAELEQRISLALDRIAAGLDHAPRAPDQPAAGGDGPAQAAPDHSALQDALRAAAEREVMVRRQHDERVAQLTRQLDVQGMELQRIRRTAVALREELRRMRQAQAAGMTDPAQINRAMLAELEAMRTARLSEMAELDELAAALDDHLTEAENA